MPITVLVIVQSFAIGKIIRRVLIQAGVEICTYNWRVSWENFRYEPVASPDLIITDDLGYPPQSVKGTPTPTITIVERHRTEKGEIGKPFTPEDMKKAMTSVGFSLS